MYRLYYAALTHPGRARGNNEDNYYVNGEYRRDIEQACCECSGNVWDGYLTASVCDGMGGQALGEVASLMAVQTLEDLCRPSLMSHASRLFRTDIMKYVNAANDKVCKRMKAEGKRIGSTVSILEFVNDTVIAVNLGDSRIYRLRDGDFKQLSTDHTTISRMIRNGQLTPEKAATHPLRHQITQYLGIFPEEMILEPAVTPISDIFVGDRYLICSDGLTDMLTDEQIKAILGGKKAVTELAQELIVAAVDAGGKDNVTAVIVEVAEPIWKFWKNRK